MAYDDVIRVADIKLRPSRFARLREEAGAAPDQLVYATEYLHPRGEEICGMMPASLGAFIEAQARSCSGCSTASSIAGAACRSGGSAASCSFMVSRL